MFGHRNLPVSQINTEIMGQVAVGTEGGDDDKWGMHTSSNYNGRGRRLVQGNGIDSFQ